MSKKRSCYVYPDDKTMTAGVARRWFASTLHRPQRGRCSLERQASLASLTLGTVPAPPGLRAAHHPARHPQCEAQTSNDLLMGAGGLAQPQLEAERAGMVSPSPKHSDERAGRAQRRPFNYAQGCVPSEAEGRGGAAPGRPKRCGEAKTSCPEYLRVSPPLH
ncbi:MAG: hypothetical protein HY352_03845 [Candidatus Omnitrophica bacterium]|nr:hypothetical protein [Candidatus Omnitrophota bacterium]